MNKMHGKEIGRNDICLCGSGKKFKKCCINKPYQPSAELLADLALGQQRVREMDGPKKPAISVRYLPAIMAGLLPINP